MIYNLMAERSFSSKPRKRGPSKPKSMKKKSSKGKYKAPIQGGKGYDSHNALQGVYHRRYKEIAGLDHQCKCGAYFPSHSDLVNHRWGGNCPHGGVYCRTCGDFFPNMEAFEHKKAECNSGCSAVAETKEEMKARWVKDWRNRK